MFDHEKRYLELIEGNTTFCYLDTLDCCMLFQIVHYQSQRTIYLPKMAKGCYISLFWHFGQNYKSYYKTLPIVPIFRQLKNSIYSNWLLKNKNILYQLAQIWDCVTRTHSSVAWYFLTMRADALFPSIKWRRIVTFPCSDLLAWVASLTTRPIISPLSPLCVNY